MTKMIQGILSLVLLSSTACAGQKMTLEKNGDNYKVNAGGQHFTTLVTGGRKSFLYPVIAAGGEQMTRHYPMKRVDGENKDHPWQSSVYFTHGSVNGEDFWNGRSSTQKKNRIVLDGPVQQQSHADGSCTLTSKQLWKSGDKVQMSDTTAIRFFATESKRCMEFTVTLQASHGDVALGDTKEGTMAVRMSRFLRLKGPHATGKVINSEGVTGKNVWGKKAAWIDYSGEINGRKVGIAMIDHPANLRYPTTWHARDYGLCAANPFGLRHFTGKKEDGRYIIKNGESLTLKYLLVFHSGDHKTAAVGAFAEAWGKK